MNTLLFKYILEVEKCRSISQAAENLFMAQPNLSKAIREVEETLGFAVFRRTPKGVVPTPQGQEFLAVARNIVSELERIESIAGDGDRPRPSLRISIPRASYIADAFARLAQAADPEGALELQVQETSAVQTITAITGGLCSLGVIRYRPEHERYFLDFLADKGLAHDTVWEDDLLLLLSGRHPLAATREVHLASLAPYTEIVHGDESVRRSRPRCSTAAGWCNAAALTVPAASATSWSIPRATRSRRWSARSSTACTRRATPSPTADPAAAP